MKIRVLHLEVLQCSSCPFLALIERGYRGELDGVDHIPVQVAAGWHCDHPTRRYDGPLVQLSEMTEEASTLTAVLLRDHNQMVHPRCPLPEQEIKPAIKGKREMDL